MLMTGASILDENVKSAYKWTALYLFLRQLLFARHPYDDSLFVRESEDVIDSISLLIANSSLSKLLYLPSEKLSNSSNCLFFEPD